MIYLKDEGCNVDVKIVKDYKKHIFINILDYDNKPVLWDSISDDIFRLIEVLEGKYSPTRAYYKINKDKIYRKDREVESLGGFIDTMLIFRMKDQPKSVELAYFSMEFADQAAYDIYNAHPDHTAFVQGRWIPEVTKFLEIDYVALK